MDISNANPSYRSDDPVWYFLAEFSINEFLSDHDRSDELRAGILFQAVQELFMPPECIDNIETTLAEFLAETLAYFKHGRMVLPARIRIFCQVKTIQDPNSANSTSRSFHAEQAVEHAHINPRAGTKTMGGWGYFLIERGAGLYSASTSTGSLNSVDLYLYKEGK